MAHFAQLDESGVVVVQVIVVHNNELLDDSGQESEARGVAFCRSLFGENTIWYQTSYNRNFRKNFAGVGFRYDPQLDAFVAPQPFPSWSLDEVTAQWLPPVQHPNNGKMYAWDEPTLTWVEVV